MPVLGVVYAPVGGVLYAGDVVADVPSGALILPISRAPVPREPIRVRPVPADGLTAVVSRSHSTPETEAYLEHYPSPSASRSARR